MRVLLVDDHPVVRQGVRDILAAEFAAARFVEAADGDQAVRAVREARPDMVILDISLPGSSGLDVLKHIRQERPTVPVLVFSVHAEDQYAVRALRAGASGYLTKGTAPEELVRAVRRALAGGRYVTPASAERLAAHLAADPDRAPHEALSDREYQALRMLGGGRSVKEAAAALGLSEKTVSTYRARVLEKLGLRNTAELVRYAVRAGIADEPEG